MTSYVIWMSNATLRANVGLQVLTAQPTMEADIVAAALAMQRAVFWPT